MIRQLGYAICSCGWRSSLARLWSGYGEWREHLAELRRERERERGQQEGKAAQSES